MADGPQGIYPQDSKSQWRYWSQTINNLRLSREKDVARETSRSRGQNRDGNRRRYESRLRGGGPLLLMNHRRGHLFILVQEYEVIGRVSVGDVPPLVTLAHPAPLKLGEPRGSEGQCQVLGSEPISSSFTSLTKKATFTNYYASSTLINVLLRLPAWQTHHSSTCWPTTSNSRSSSVSAPSP